MYNSVFLTAEFGSVVVMTHCTVTRTS